MTELLLPISNMQSLRVAIANGADAVYFGVGNFNARMRADSITMDTAKEAICFAHSYGVKVYITLNILIYDNEFAELTATARALADFGVDAFILQDLGAFKALKALNLGIDFHASTQLGCNNLYSARLLEKLGFSRVVLARETRLQDIKEIKQKTKIEIEYFVQGALCVAFSGNCYLSAYDNSNSGNRGKCLQLCRLPYTLQNQDKGKNTTDAKGTKGQQAEKTRQMSRDSFLLSAKDLSLIENLDILIDAGVDSLKIEGRMRRIGYVGVASNVYRQVLDQLILKNLAKGQSGNISVLSEVQSLPTIEYSSQKARSIDDKQFAEVEKTEENTNFDKYTNSDRYTESDEYTKSYEYRDLISKIKEHSTTSCFKGLRLMSNGLYQFDDIFDFAGDMGRAKAMLRQVFSRGEYLDRAYLDSTTPQVVEPKHNNHIGVSIGSVKAVSKFKDIYKIEIETKTQLNDGDGLKFFDEQREVASMGIGGAKKTNNGYDVFSKTPLTVGLRVHKILDKQIENRVEQSKRLIPIAISVSANAGERLSATATAFLLSGGQVQKTSFSAQGDTVEFAKSESRIKEDLNANLSKLGDTQFLLVDLDCVGDNGFLPKSKINELRRQLVAGLDECIREKGQEQRLRSASVQNSENANRAEKKDISKAEEAIQTEAIKIDADQPADSNCKKAGKLVLNYCRDELLDFETGDIVVLSPRDYNAKSVGSSIAWLGRKGVKNIALRLPVILNSKDIVLLKKAVNENKNDISSLVLENYGHFELAYEMQNETHKNFDLIAGNGLNIVNREQIELTTSLGAIAHQTSYESKANFSAQNSVVVKNFKLPLMTFAHCPHKTTQGQECKNCTRSDDIIISHKNKNYVIERTRVAGCCFELFSLD